MISLAEVATMQAMASERWCADGPYVEHHPGDVAWGSTQPVGEVRAHFFDEAYALSHGDEWHVGGTAFGELADAALAAGAAVWALERETVKAEALRARGFTPVEERWFWHFARDLDDLPPMTVAPSAYEPDERVAVHRAAWHPSRLTREVYDTVRTMPLYREDLDVLVRTPDGDPAAYVLAWYDPASASGDFEPMGTDPRFRRQGYGAAACVAALHRLRDAGARTAVVYAVSDPANPGPAALYRSVGFRAIDRHVEWRAPIRQNAPRGGTS